MKNINKNMNISNNDVEFIWDETHYKVILFQSGDPVAYVNLPDNFNNLENAVQGARKILEGKGTKLFI